MFFFFFGFRLGSLGATNSGHLHWSVNDKVINKQENELVRTLLKQRNSGRRLVVFPPTILTLKSAIT